MFFTKKLRALLTECTLVIKMGRAPIYEPTEPTFELHGVRLFGSFRVILIGGTWSLSGFQYTHTQVGAADIRKLVEASKSGIEVPVKFGDGQGKAKILSLSYDPNMSVLTGITFELTDWMSV